ncbi:hypothetical protein ACFQPA_01390 [Halomarina halobia]|uniref:hypothetical protein n=1 Tax=Halomarina halobia TaxID=3033386 RepID=UPI0023E87EB5|nr:hypothetical protein [Halomarina sp. PSR21]
MSDHVGAYAGATPTAALRAGLGAPGGPVPAGVVHRDVTPSDEGRDYVLWLTRSEPRVAPVDGPAGMG